VPEDRHDRGDGNVRLPSEHDGSEVAGEVGPEVRDPQRAEEIPPVVVVVVLVDGVPIGLQEEHVRVVRVGLDPRSLVDHHLLSSPEPPEGTGERLDEGDAASAPGLRARLGDQPPRGRVARELPLHV